MATKGFWESHLHPQDKEKELLPVFSHLSIIEISASGRKSTGSGKLMVNMLSWPTGVF